MVAVERSHSRLSRMGEGREGQGRAGESRGAS